MQNLSELSTQLGQLLQQGDQVLVTAESCTGGGVATAITDIAGSSTWFDRAFVTYSNDAKMEMLGVRQKRLANMVRSVRLWLWKWRKAHSTTQMAP